jgi:hypothetical protein
LTSQKPRHGAAFGCITPTPIVYYTEVYKRRQPLDVKNKNDSTWLREQIPRRAATRQVGARCCGNVASAANADRSHVVAIFTAGTVPRGFVYCCKSGVAPEPAPAAFLPAGVTTDPAAGR